jgi:hypothetical protein
LHCDHFGSAAPAAAADALAVQVFRELVVGVLVTLPLPQPLLALGLVFVERRLESRVFRCSLFAREFVFLVLGEFGRVAVAENRRGFEFFLVVPRRFLLCRYRCNLDKTTPQ